MRDCRSGQSQLGVLVWVSGSRAGVVEWWSGEGFGEVEFEVKLRLKRWWIGWCSERSEDYFFGGVECDECGGGGSGNGAK